MSISAPIQNDRSVLRRFSLLGQSTRALSKMGVVLLTLLQANVVISKNSISSTRKQIILELEEAKKTVEHKASLHKKRIEKIFSRIDETKDSGDTIDSKRKNLWKRAALRRSIKSERSEYVALLDEINDIESVLNSMSSTEIKVHKQAKLWTPPVAAQVNNMIGVRKKFGESKIHRDVEFRVKDNEQIFSPNDGKIAFHGPIKGLGEVMVIESIGVVSVLYPVKGSAAKHADLVRRGAPIGKTTGPRLHWELRVKIGDKSYSFDPYIE